MQGRLLTERSRFPFRAELLHGLETRVPLSSQIARGRAERSMAEVVLNDLHRHGIELSRPPIERMCSVCVSKSMGTSATELLRIVILHGRRDGLQRSLDPFGQARC